MVDLMCCFGFGVLCFALHLFLPTNLCLTGSLAGIAPCSFALPRLGFVINLFFILLSGRSAVENMSVGGLKPHVPGELELGICFNLSTFNILNWKATEISSFSLSLEFCVILQHLLLKPLGHAFQLRGVGMFMAQIRFVAWLIILALSAGAADTNSTDVVNAEPNLRGMSASSRTGCHCLNGGTGCSHCNMYNWATHR